MLSPWVPPAPAGNATSVGRWATHLARAGCRVRLLDTGSPGAAEQLDEALREETFDLIHAHHARRSASLVVRRPGPRPALVVTLGGTDIEGDLDRPGHAAEVRAAFAASSAVGVFTLEQRARVCREAPGKPVRTIPKGVELPPDPPGPPPPEPILFLPAGRRREKGMDLVLDLAGPLAAEFPRMRLVVAGPVYDRTLHEEFASRARGLPWVEDLATLPRAAMACAYARATVVLNVSRTEGVPNSLLEAMAGGRPALASDIPGNRRMVRDGVTGFLYRSPEEFRDRARRLLSDLPLRVRMGTRAFALARDEHSPEREAAEIRALYRDALGRV